ncbi:MAG: RNA polymerase sigma factor region1.1 domain-containing protein [Arenicella sp.]
MTNYEKLRNKGLVQGSLSLDEIFTVMENEIKLPSDFAEVKEKLESEGIIIDISEQSQKLQALIKKGVSNGLLKRTEIVLHLPFEMVDQEQINDIIQMIEGMGIKVEN